MADEKKQQYPIRMDISGPVPVAAPRAKNSQPTYAGFDQTVAGWREGQELAARIAAQAAAGKRRQRDAYASAAFLPTIYAAKGAANDLVEPFDGMGLAKHMVIDPVSDLIQYFGSGSGGELPASAKPKATTQTNRAQPVKTQRQPASSVYDELVSRFIGAMGDKVSLNQLGALSRAVPSPSKAPSGKDTAIFQGLGLAKELYQAEMAQLRDEGRSAVDGPDATERYFRRIQAYGADPMKEIMAAQIAQMLNTEG